jgi:hypothetical protein
LNKSILRWRAGRLAGGATSPPEAADTFYPTHHGIFVDWRVSGVERASVADPGT